MRGKHDIGDPIMCSCGAKFATLYGLYTHRKKFSHPPVSPKTSSSNTASRQLATPVMMIKSDITIASSTSDIVDSSSYIELKGIDSEIMDKGIDSDGEHVNFNDAGKETRPTGIIYEAESLVTYEDDDDTKIAMKENNSDSVQQGNDKQIVFCDEFNTESMEAPPSKEHEQKGQRQRKSPRNIQQINFDYLSRLQDEELDDYDLNEVIKENVQNE